MKTIAFTITIQGTGSTPEEAWNDAVEGFIMDSGICPEEDSQTIIEED